MTTFSAGPQRDGAAKALVCLSFFLFAVSDVVAKHVSRDFSVNQVIFVSAAVTFVPVLLFMRATRDRRYLPLRLGLCVVRSLFACISVILLVESFGRLPVADAYTLSFTAPLIVAALSGLFLGERVGTMQWAAIVVGFAGVVVVLGPGFGAGGADAASGAAQVGMGLALVSAVFFALGILLLRRIGTSESAGSILIVFLLTTLVVTGVPLLWEWRTPSRVEDWGAMVLIGFAAGGAHIAMVSAFRRGEAARLAPFQYTQLVWGVVLGLLVFGDRPSLQVVTGAAIVVGAGLMLYLEERRAARAMRAAGAQPPS